MTVVGVDFLPMIADEKGLLVTGLLYGTGLVTGLSSLTTFFCDITTFFLCSKWNF